MEILLKSARLVLISCFLILCFVEYQSAFPHGEREERDVTFRDIDEKEKIASINLQSEDNNGGGIAGWLIGVIIVLVIFILVLVLVIIWLCIRCVCSARVEDSLKRNHKFKTLRKLQQMRALNYIKETIVMPEMNIVHTSISAVTVAPEIENFPDPFNVNVYYTIEKQQKKGPFNAEEAKHELAVENKKEPKRVTASASDPHGYKAQCSFAILEGPTIEPITNHSRTSASTAIVRMVECTNFRTNTPVKISYSDGINDLGEYPADGEHRLQNLKRTTKDIKARAVDEVGNVAETTFVIDQKVPTVSYGSIVRTPNSIIVKDVHLENFPTKEDAVVTYASEGQDEHTDTSATEEHVVPGRGQSFQGKIMATATDANKEYLGECEIVIHGPGPCIDPITKHSRTSITTAKIPLVHCSNFPAANPVQVTYYDGDEAIGQFLAGQEHKLTRLKKTTQDIKVTAVDELGNLAETTFTVDQDIPMISYGRVSRTPTSVVVKGIKLENFPNQDGVTVTYSCDGQQDYQTKASGNEHVLPGYSQSWEGGVIKVVASDASKEFTAESEITIEGPGPVLGAISDQARTSVSTATIRQVECANFPADSQVQINYYDDQESLGKLPPGGDHKLTNLKRTTGEVRVQATDDFGNIAETTFTVDQNIPSVSFENIFRTTKAICVKGVKFENFPDNGAIVIYSAEGHDDHQASSAESEHEIPGFKPSWEGHIYAKASDGTQEYTAECKLEIEPLMETYHIYVVTASKFGAGTDANVYINIVGEEDETGQQPLKKSTRHMNKFESGNTDEFHIKAVQVGDIPKIVIGHDGSGPGAGWKLDRVEIEAPSLSKRLYFPCGRWLDKGEDDGLTERELVAVERQLETYHIWVTTSDVKGAGTDANVYINIEGEEAETGQEFLKKCKNHTNKFERGKTDEFEIEAIKIGEIKKLTIGHDNAGGWAGWKLERVEIESPANPGKRLFFPCARWFDKKEDDGLIERELTPTEREMETYNIFVTTSDVSGAGTDANVYINIYGEEDDTGETFLKKSKNNKNKFERGKVDEFELKLAKVGEIKKLKIGHDNKGGFAGWMLDRVEIEAPSLGLGKRVLFPCGRWFDNDKDDKLIERELTPSEHEMETYTIFVTTPDVSGAGTDANVYIMLYGDELETDKIFLNKSKNNKNKFESDQTDEFDVEGIKVGDIRRIRIGHDNKGGFAGWMLDKVEIEAPSLDKRMFFPCGRWFDKDEDDGLIERELTPLEHGMETYNISVITSDVKGAGSDANVFIILYGPHGNTGKQFLKKSKTHKDKFERGKTDEFDLETGNVGEIEKIRIGHDNKGGFAGWMLDKVEIGAPSLSKPLAFYCGKWFDKKKDDGEIERDLVPGEQPVQEEPEMETYSVFVTTSDKKGAGTDANVYIILCGEDGDTGKQSLKKSKTHRDKFERGNTDEFDVTAPKIGELKSIKIGHDNSGFGGAGWMLGNVEVEAPSVSKRLHFACDRWLDKKEDDGLIERELFPMSENGTNGTPSVDPAATEAPAVGGGGDKSRGNETYQVYVTTSDVKGAGTDANVYVTIVGEHGDSGQHFLKKSLNHKDKFESGKTDLFEVSTTDLGTIQKIKIGHDNEGGFAGWRLDHVELEAPSIGKRLIFPCDRWLDLREDDGLIERELNAFDKETYNIFVTTSDTKGAGTDANVYIIIYGDKGDTGKLPLKKSKTHRDKFERGHLDEFKMETCNVGEVTSIKIGHDNSGFGGAGWMLDHVELEAPSISSRLHFACGRWLDKKKDDKQIERELTPQ